MRSDWYGGECFSFESKRGGGCLSLNYDDTNTVRMLRTETRTCSDGGMDMKTYRLSAISKTINRSEKLSTTRSVKSADERVRDGMLEVRCGRRLAGVWYRRDDGGGDDDARPRSEPSVTPSRRLPTLRISGRSVGRSVGRYVRACWCMRVAKNSSKRRGDGDLLPILI